MRRGVPLFSAEATRLLNRGPAWHEHPDFWREDPPEDVEEMELMCWLESLPEAEEAA